MGSDLRFIPGGRVDGGLDELTVTEQVGTWVIGVLHVPIHND
jgi:hypothetical protein